MRAIVIVLSTLAIASISINSQPGDHVSRNAVSQAMAVERAIAYIGLDNDSSDYDYDRISAHMIKISNDKTPLVDSAIKDQEVWEVHMPNVPVGRADEMVILPFWIHRDFKVLIDPVNGYLLSVYSLCDSVGSSDTLPEPTPAKANEYLSGRGIVFTAFPDSIPDVPLLEAFKGCIFKEPAYAKVIRAIYINYSTNNRDYTKRWLIILRGTKTPMSAHGPGASSVPTNHRNILMFSIDATTGRCDYMTNAPYDINVMRLRNR